MTNAQIISNAQFDLMKAGKIGSTGRNLEFIDEAGNVFSMPEPEPIHTFRYWKECGYAVKKGEKAVAKITIWKHTVKHHDIPEDADPNTAAILAEPETHMFMKTACFFSASQVQPNIIKS